MSICVSDIKQFCQILFPPTYIIKYFLIATSSYLAYQNYVQPLYKDYVEQHAYNIQLEDRYILLKFISMKKHQFKINTNKVKLQINRPNIEQGKALIVKNQSFKQNQNIFAKLQQKEEKQGKTNQFLGICNNNTSEQYSNRPERSDMPSPTLGKALSRPKSRQKVDRRSSSVSFKKNDELILPPSAVINQIITNFINLLHQKKILSFMQTNYLISSENMQHILLFIITTKSNSHKNEANDLLTMISQIALDNFLCQHRSSCCQLDINKKSLALCSKNISEMHFGKGINGEIVKQLSKVAGDLRQEVAELECKKRELQTQIEKKMHEIRQNERKNLVIQLKIEHSEIQISKLAIQIQKNKCMLHQTQCKKNQLQNFVNLQSNLIAKQAAEYHKNLEIDLFQYSDFLKHHPLGRKQFQPSIYYNQIERLIDVQIKQATANLLQERRSQEDKGKSLKDFLQRIQHQYSLMTQELTHVIDQKTKSIQKFTSFIDRWYQNYLAKKQYLSGLAEVFSLQVVTLKHLRKNIEMFYDEQDNRNSSSAKHGLKKVFTGVDKLIQIFGLGNSFY